MKNLLIISQSLTGGGAEKVAANLSLELSKRYNVFLVTYKKNEKEYEHKGTRIDIDCIGGGASIIKKIGNALYRIRSLKRIKRQYNIDYSLSLVPQTDYANVFSRTRREKIIIEVSSNTSAAFKSFFSRFVRRIILLKSDKIVTVSKGSQSDLIKLFSIPQKKITCIYNTCDIATIKRKAQLSGKWQVDYPYVVAMGSFRKPKGHWHLIKAFSLLKKDYPELKLVIIGDGEYKKLYLNLIENLGLEAGDLILPGFLENPYPIISRASLFVFPSIYEGFGNAIIEAMACGVPVVSSDCKFGPKEIIAPEIDLTDEIKEMIINDYGCITPHLGDDDIDCSKAITGQEIILYQAMKKIMENKELTTKLIENGRKRCLAFDNGTICENWSKVIEELVNEGISRRKKNA